MPIPAAHYHALSAERTRASLLHAKHHIPPEYASAISDAVVAATAVESAEVLLTANLKHYRPVKELRTKPFKP